MRSGFCNPANDAASHARCPVAIGTTCDCPCHTDLGAGGAGQAAPAKPWYSAACIGGKPETCPRINGDGTRTCANPAHEGVVPEVEAPHVYLPSGPSESSSDRSCKTCGGFYNEEGSNHVPVPEVVDRAGGRRRRWRCPKCDQLVFKADHVVGTTFACDEPAPVPDDLYPPGEQTVVPMAGVDLPMSTEEHQAQEAAEDVTWPKPPPWEIETLRETPWDDDEPHGKLEQDDADRAWPEDEHNHEWERTDGVRCCPCGAWIEETPDGPTGVVREAGWQPTLVELTQEERRQVIAAHLIHRPEAILETVREIVEARLQGREPDGNTASVAWFCGNVGCTTIGPHEHQGGVEKA